MKGPITPYPRPMPTTQMLMDVIISQGIAIEKLTESLKRNSEINCALAKKIEKLDDWTVIVSADAMDDFIWDNK